jgi:hypothetical protein
MSASLNSLPFRRLKQYANGIYDETRKTFYPFLSSNSTVLGKKSIAYYVKSAYVTGTNEGDHVVSYIGWTGTLGGNTKYICYIVVPASVAASNVNSFASVNVNVGVLFDANKDLTQVSTATTASQSIVYAEIPIDQAGGPVVVV